MVHLRVPEQLFRESEEAAAEFGFHSLQEYFRNAVRAMNEEYTKRRALTMLERNFGRGKGKPIKKVTQAERRKMFLEFCKEEDTSHLFREVGLGHLLERQEVRDVPRDNTLRARLRG